MKKLILRIKLITAFVSLVRDPRKTDRIFAMAGAIRKDRRDIAMKSLAHHFNDPGFRALHTAQDNPRTDLENLRQRPDGSFGRAVARFLDQHGFDANAFPMLSYDDPLEFMVSRLRQNHDYWHVLTGYETSVPDELGLQAFTYAQVGAMISTLILAGGLLHLSIYNPSLVRDAMEKIVDGYRRGKQCRSLVSFRLEDRWDASLTAVRAELGLLAPAEA